MACSLFARQDNLVPIAVKTTYEMNFHKLTDSIDSIDTSFRHAAVGTVNRMLTLRNWLIGCHIIVELIRIADLLKRSLLFGSLGGKCSGGPFVAEVPLKKESQREL